MRSALRLVEQRLQPRDLRIESRRRGLLLRAISFRHLQLVCSRIELPLGGGHLLVAPGAQ